MPLDEGGRLIVALLAESDDLNEDQRTRAIKFLIDDGLSYAEIIELYPRLLSFSPSTRQRTTASRHLRLVPTDQQSRTPESETGSQSGASEPFLVRACR